VTSPHDKALICFFASLGAYNMSPDVIYLEKKLNNTKSDFAQISATMTAKKALTYF
jgi:hypothetical protein